MDAITGHIRSEKLKQFIFSGLELAAEMRTSQTLGKRNYIGASDIAVAFDCMRKAVMDKLSSSVKDSLEGLLMKERGHWQEYGLKEAFQAKGVTLLHQAEIGFRGDDGVEYKFHPDFILISRDLTVVIESKSMGRPPEIYSSFLRQVSLQVHALARYWHEKAFRINLSDNYVTFEELVEKVTQKPLHLRPNVEGWVVCIGKDRLMPSEPVYPDDEMFWKEAMHLGSEISRCLSNPVDLPYANGVYPLCTYCNTFLTCPKFDADTCEQFAPEIEELVKMKRQYQELEARIDLAEVPLKRAYSAIAPKLPAGKLYMETSAGKLAYLERSRENASAKRLRASLKRRINDPLLMKAILADVVTETKFNQLSLYPTGTRSAT